MRRAAPVLLAAVLLAGCEHSQKPVVTPYLACAVEGDKVTCRHRKKVTYVGFRQIIIREYIRSGPWSN